MNSVSYDKNRYSPSSQIEEETDPEVKECLEEYLKKYQEILDEQKELLKVVCDKIE